jgi:2-aminobenzoate-CoA ligase
MKDRYPATKVPAHVLVPPEDQPDYADFPAPALERNWNVGYQLADAQVAAGRGPLPAAINAATGRIITFEELARESSRVAAGLVALGVQPGDRVAYQSVNDPEVLIVMAGIWKSGAVAVPIPAYAKDAELVHFVEDSKTRFLFAHAHARRLAELRQSAKELGVEEVFGFGPGHAEAGIPSCDGMKREGALPATDPDQLAILWHTGGTTGRPKGCYHTHRRFLLAGHSFGLSNAVAPGQRWAATTPIGHALGIIHNTIYSIQHGATVVMMENFSDPETVLQAVHDHGITTLTGLMGSWAKMADLVRRDEKRWDLSSLKRCFAMWQSASAADVFDFWLARGIELYNNFGSTSFANWILVPPPGKPSPRASLGCAAVGYEVAAVAVENGKVRILPPGEIGQLAVKGPSGLTYWNLPELQKRDVAEGWTLSDDLIRFDEKGYAHYLGRTDYMISTSGYKVAPGEVEEVLSRHPSVREVAVVPAPCAIRLEQIVAYVSLNPDIQPSEALKQELRDLAKESLTFYKAPRQVVFVDALPRDAVGKVQSKIVKGWANEAGFPS